MKRPERTENGGGQTLHKSVRGSDPESALCWVRALAGSLIRMDNENMHRPEIRFSDKLSELKRVDNQNI